MAQQPDIRDTLELASNLKNRHVVALEDAIFNLPKPVLMRANASNAAATVYVKAAITAQWIANPTVEVGVFENETRYFIDNENIDDMDAWAVRYIGARIESLYSELVNVPKN